MLMQRNDFENMKITKLTLLFKNETIISTSYNDRCVKQVDCVDNSVYTVLDHKKKYCTIHYWLLCGYHIRDHKGHYVILAFAICCVTFMIDISDLIKR